MSRVITKGLDYTSKDYESFRNDMINQLRIKMPEYTDISQSDAGIVILELLAQGLDVISYYQDVIANEMFLVTEEQRNNALKWCQLLNYTPRTSTPAKFKQVFVLTSPQIRDTVIPAGTKVKTQESATDGQSLYYETESDLIIPKGALGNETQNGEYLYSVNVVHGETVSDELLGSSTGVSNQSFKLGYRPVIVDSISVFVNEGSGFEKWSKVDNFIDSGSTSKDYIVSVNDYDEVTITFGDGVFGKIPTAHYNGIYCSYRVGGGSKGNVGANKISVLDANIALVASTFNPSTAFESGQDKETLDEIKVNAPMAHKNIWGALTVEDFAGVVKINFSPVDKVASYATGDRNRDIAIYVLLKNDATLTDSLKQEMLDLFDENKGGRKLIGSGEVSVYPAIKVPVDIVATLSVKPRYNFNTVRANITTFLNNYFKVGNYDFNTELSIPSLCAEVMNPDNEIEGIRYFTIDSPSDVVLTPNKGVIYTLGSLTINNGGA